MNKTRTNLVMIALIASGTSGCITNQKGMREPNSKVDFVKSDFRFSEQLTGQGKDTKILGIDFFRIGHSSDMGYVKGEEGRITLGIIPVIGNYLSDESSYYALYDLMSKNPGYDVIFYPQYEKHIVKPFLGIGFIYKKTTVKATARLAKLKD
jgi:hypothetical protein